MYRNTVIWALCIICVVPLSFACNYTGQGLVTFAVVAAIVACFVVAPWVRLLLLMPLGLNRVQMLICTAPTSLVQLGALGTCLGYRLPGASVVVIVSLLLAFILNWKALYIVTEAGRKGSKDEK